MKFILSNSVELGQSIYINNKWYKITKIDKDCITIGENQQVKFGDYIDGWKL